MLINYLRHGELRQKFLWTVALVCLFRLMAHIPVFNVDEERLNQLLADNPLIGAVDLFAGGEVLDKFSMVAAGILPYLLAIGLVKGLAWVIPPLAALRRRGEDGQKRLELIAKVASAPLAFFFAWGLSRYLNEKIGFFPRDFHLFSAATFWVSLRVVGLMTLGSIVSTALTDRITKVGVGSGAGVILLVGSSVGFFDQVVRVFQSEPAAGPRFERLALMAASGLVALVLSIYLGRTQRRIPIQYAKRTTEKPRYGSSGNYLPFLLNRGGVLAVSAATGALALLRFVGDFLGSHFGGGFAGVKDALDGWITGGGVWYWAVLACLIILFTYISNFSVLWEPMFSDGLPLVESLRRQSAYIPGFRPGLKTEAYLTFILWRITLPGALGLAFLAAVLPALIHWLTQQNSVPTVISLMITVKTVDDVGQQMESEVVQDSYDSFLTRGRLRGRI